MLLRLLLLLWVLLVRLLLRLMRLLRRRNRRSALTRMDASRISSGTIDQHRRGIRMWLHSGSLHRLSGAGSGACIACRWHGQLRGPLLLRGGGFTTGRAHVRRTWTGGGAGFCLLGLRRSGLLLLLLWRPWTRSLLLIVGGSGSRLCTLCHLILDLDKLLTQCRVFRLLFRECLLQRLLFLLVLRGLETLLQFAHFRLDGFE